MVHLSFKFFFAVVSLVSLRYVVDKPVHGDVTAGQTVHSFSVFHSISKKTIYENWTSINWYFPGQGKDEHKWMRQQQLTVSTPWHFPYKVLPVFIWHHHSVISVILRPEGHQHGVSIQSFINLVETTLWTTFEWQPHIFKSSLAKLSYPRFMT